MADYDFDIGIIGGGSGGLQFRQGRHSLAPKLFSWKKRMNWEETASTLVVSPVKPLSGQPMSTIS